MSVFETGLPTSIKINGNGYKINSDYRLMLKIEDIILSDNKREETGFNALSLFYYDIPEDVGAAADRLVWFYRGGDTLEIAKQKSGRRSKQAETQKDFSWKYDWGYIYAAFLEQYSIDLIDIKYLHWWKFKALIDSLKPEHYFNEIRRCRTQKITANMSKDQKEYINKMKERYALPIPENIKKEIDALEAALLGNGDIKKVLENRK